MLKKLLIVALVKKLLLLAILAIWGAFSAQAFSTEKFLELYPDAIQEGNCYLLRLDDCNIIAVINDYSNVSDIGIIFVQHKQKQKSQATAKKLAADISNSEIMPFVGGDGSTAIICPTTLLSMKSPLRVLLYPSVSTSKRAIQFFGWQGKSVKARIDLDALPSTSSSSSSSTSSSSRKKSKGIIEMTVNLEEALVTCAEFRISKGRIDADDMRDFIRARMCSTITSSSMMPSLSVKGKKELRSLYANNEIIAYSSSYDFCIVGKAKTYRAGTLDGVKDVVRNNKRDNIAFNFPTENLKWPHESARDEGDDASGAFATAADTDDKPKRNSDTTSSGSKSVADTTEKPSGSRNKEPIIAALSTAEKAVTPDTAPVDLNIDKADMQTFSITVARKVAINAQIIHKEEGQQESTLNPAQVYKNYMESIKKM